MSELRETFDHFDKDSNGAIDRQEFAQIMEALGAEMTAEEIDLGFKIIDTDGNGVIDFDELSSWWSER